ncbi:MAG: 1-acyl-sn-glycerol-3-phosphate acyltransferase [Alphaproteobacteria bacterium]|nr:1-acyl-sn-glycerol-3-phosphate acyltransferase [Alphaproteobacteria bacterium]
MTAPVVGLRDKVVGAGLWGLGLTWLGLTVPPLTLLMQRVPSDRIDRLTRAYTRGQVAATLCRWRAHVDPAVDPATPYLFAQNHVNVLDHVTMYAATPHFKQGIELRRHFDIPLYGPFMRARGTIPVDPGDKAAMLQLRRAFRAELDRGHSLLAFPEGTRTRTGRVGPFQHGLFHVARQVGVPVVPVAVTGMWEVLPTGGWVMRPFQQVDVHVMAPIPTAGLSRDAVPELAQTVHDRIAAVVDAYYAARGGEPA